MPSVEYFVRYRKLRPAEGQTSLPRCTTQSSNTSSTHPATSSVIHPACRDMSGTGRAYADLSAGFQPCSIIARSTHMAQTDISNCRCPLTGVVHRLQVCEEYRSGRNDGVDVREKRLGFVKGDDLAHLLFRELAQRVGIALASVGPFSANRDLVPTKS